MNRRRLFFTGVFVASLSVGCAQFNPFDLLGKSSQSILPFDLSGLFTSQTNNEIELGLDKIQLIHYQRSAKGGEMLERAVVLDDAVDLMDSLDKRKPFVLYIHGFQEHVSNESIQTVVSAYLKRGTDNIVALDWSPVAFDNYLIVASRMKDIARLTSQAITNLAAAGLNVDTLHVVGHSMGAQVAGFMGQYLGFKLPRVTGLDPANPLFYQFGADHISEKSAAQVDIIHTDGGFYGAYPNTGSVDIFPNGGHRAQPGCHLFGLPLSPRGLCSHWRSWRFYAESVVNNEAFPAVKCRSYDDFNAGKCKGNQVIYLGYSIPRDATGTFYLTTNDKSPFGKGLDGIKPNV